MYQDVQALIGQALAPFVLVPVGVLVATLIALVLVDAVDSVFRPKKPKP